MRMLPYRMSIAVLLLLIPAETRAATPGSAPPEEVILHLQDALDLALEQSYEARNLQLDLLRARQNAEAAQGRFRTFADLQLDTPRFDERFQEVRVPDQPSAFENIETVDWQGTLSVNQPLPTNGLLSLVGSLRQLNQSTFLEPADNLEDNRFFTSLRLDLSQPLLVPNTLKLNLERANLERERAEMRYTRTQLDVIYDVTDAFYALYRAEQQVEIAHDTKQQQQRSYSLAHRKFEAGLIPEVEALQMEVDLANSDNSLLQAQGALERAKDSFKITVGLDMDAAIGAAASLELHSYDVDGELALRHALAHRAEIREGEINARLAEISLDETDARSTIRGEVRAFYEITGISDESLRTRKDPFDLFNSSLDDLRERPDNKGVSLSVTVPLWDSGVNGAEVAAARATLAQRALDEKQSRRLVIQQVNSSIIRLRESERRVTVLRKSETVAQRSYQISSARFENGEITSQELALDRDRLTQARLSTLDAFIQYQLASADLKRQTLYDFENGHSLVEGGDGE